MPPLYIDGRVPLDVTTLNASADVATPYLMQGAGAKTLAVPNPAANDTIAVLTATQTMANKTISGVGCYFTGNVTHSDLITSANIGSSYFYSGTVYGSIIYDDVTTAGIGTPKTLRIDQANVFIVNLTAGCTLTVADGFASSLGLPKSYHVIVQQNIANSYTAMSWMTGFVNGAVDSGPTQRTGAIDFWQIVWDPITGKHYGIGAKDVQ